MATINGIEYGFKSTNMVLTANMWGGVANVGEIGVSGTTITKFDDTELSLGTLGNGVACSQDNVKGDAGYLMYSVDNVRTRFSASPPHPDGADHLVFVRYSGSSWYYDNNTTDVAFTPVSSDLLVADVVRGVVSVIPATLKRYWVGGAGDWSDTNHWALTSNGSAGGVADYYATANTADWCWGTYTYGQSFTGNGGVLSKISVYGKKYGSPTGSIYAKVYAHSGTYGTSSVPTGSALATSVAVDISTMSTSATPVNFEFLSTMTLTNGTKYVLMIEYPSGVGWQNSFYMYKHNSSPTHSGNKVNTTTAAPGEDLWFYVYTGTHISIPTQYDDVYIDSSSGFSGGGTLTVKNNGYCHNFTSNTGHTYNLSSSGKYIDLYKNLELEPGVTNSVRFRPTGSESATINLNGGTDEGGLYPDGSGTKTLISDWTSGIKWYGTGGVIDANGYDVGDPTVGGGSSFNCYPGSGSTFTIYMGEGNWYLGSEVYLTNKWYGGTLNLYCETSTIHFCRSSVTFEGGDNTFYDAVWKSTCDDLTIYDSNTFNSFTEETTDNYHNLYFQSGTTNTFSSFKLNGVDGNETMVDASWSTILSISDNYSNVPVYSGSTTKIGQSFTADTNSPFYAGNFYVKKVGSPTGNLYIKLYAHSGTYGTNSLPTGDPLAVSDPLDVSTLYTYDSYYKRAYFTGDNLIRLSSGTQYVVVLEYDGGDATNYVNVCVVTSSVHSGNSCTYNGSWATSVNDVFGRFYTKDVFNLIQSSGTVECEKIDVSYSNVAGGATWIAYNSIDSGDNTGWSFLGYGVAGVNDLSLTSSTDTFTGDALTQPDSEILSLSNPSTTNYGYSFVQSAVGGLSITDPSINTLGKGLYNAIAQILRFTNLSVSLDWDYLYISKSKNTTNWSEKSENSTTWTNQSKALTDWKEL